MFVNIHEKIMSQCIPWWCVLTIIYFNSLSYFWFSIKLHFVYNISTFFFWLKSYILTKNTKFISYNWFAFIILLLCSNMPNYYASAKAQVINFLRYVHVFQHIFGNINLPLCKLLKNWFLCAILYSSLSIWPHFNIYVHVSIILFKWNLLKSFI